MAYRFVVEVNRRVVGIAVRARGGFKFFASDHAFRSLDGQTFPGARAVERAAKALHGSIERLQGRSARRAAGGLLGLDLGRHDRILR